MSHENTNADYRDSGSVTDGRLHGCHVRNLCRGGYCAGHLADQLFGRRLGKEANTMRYIGPVFEFAAIVALAVLFWVAVLS